VLVLVLVLVVLLLLLQLAVVTAAHHYCLHQCHRTPPVHQLVVGLVVAEVVGARRTGRGRPMEEGPGVGVGALTIWMLRVAVVEVVAHHRLHRKSRSCHSHCRFHLHLNLSACVVVGGARTRLP
jgi:hypothetical protein